MSYKLQFISWWSSLGLSSLLQLLLSLTLIQSSINFTNVISNIIFIIPLVVFIAVDLRPILLKYRYVEVFVFFVAVAVVIAVTTAVTVDVTVTVTIAITVTVAVDILFLLLLLLLLLTLILLLSLLLLLMLLLLPTTTTTTSTTSTTTTYLYDTTDLTLTMIINFPTVSDTFWKLKRLSSAKARITMSINCYDNDFKCHYYCSVHHQWISWCDDSTISYLKFWFRNWCYDHYFPIHWRLRDY